MAKRQDTSINKRAHRFAELQTLLRDKPRTVKELAGWFGVPARTINRDLQDLGIQGNNQRPPHYTLRDTPIHLEAGEAIAAHTALRLLYHHSPDRSKSHQRALEKLAKQLPSNVRHIIQASINQDTKPHDNPRTLEVIANAWMQNHVVGFDYIKPGGSGETRYNEIEVYFIEVSRSNLELYVIGQRRNWKPAIRTFRLGLMRNTKPFKQHTYSIPKDFDPRAYLSNAWGVIGDQTSSITVRLKFEASVTTWLQERRFPGVQHIETLENGDQIYTIQTGVDANGQPRELMPWIRGWGAKIEILTPQALREQWLSDAREVLERHERKT